jgi:hypothetical protein
VAVVFSAYYGYRGYVGNRYAWRVTNAQRAKGELPELPAREVISVYCVHDVLFHVLCSLAGFLSLVASRLETRIATM